MVAEFGQKCVKSTTELNAAIIAPTLPAADIPIVVDFFGVWCGARKTRSLRHDQLAGEFSGQIQFVSVKVGRRTLERSTDATLSNSEPARLPASQFFQLISSNRGGWSGRVAGARWMQGGTGLPG
jgi:hypothetical protein